MDYQARLKYIKDYAQSRKQTLSKEPLDFNFGGLQDGLALMPDYYHDSLQRCKVCQLKYNPGELLNSLCRFCIATNQNND